jgi:hypothetical protein
MRTDAVSILDLVQLRSRGPYGSRLLKPRLELRSRLSVSESSSPANPTEPLLSLVTGPKSMEIATRTEEASLVAVEGEVGGTSVGCKDDVAAVMTVLRGPLSSIWLLRRGVFPRLLLLAAEVKA